MYLLYVDESGDIGLQGSPSTFFALSGFVVHELRWQAVLDSVVTFRRALKARYGLMLREELHAHAFLHKPGPLARIRKDLRLRILRDALDFQSAIPDVSVISVLVEKKGKPAGYDVFENAWTCLVQRFHNTISHKNFPEPQNPQDLGLLVTDKTDEPKLRLLTRRMHRYNPVPGK